MSTKNLSRTVIEGGRCGHYKSDVSTNARSERAETRAYLRKVTDDPDADLVQPKRQTVPACFADKTRPILRFLHARVGSAWDEVRSEVFQKFDARTTAGRHVLFDHLLSEVDDGSQGIPPSWRSLSRFFVDDDGVLRERARMQQRYSRYVNLTRWAVPAATWLRGRKIGTLGDRYVWFEAVRATDRIGVIWRGVEFMYVNIDADGRVMYFDRVRTVYGHLMAAEPMPLPRWIAFRQCNVLTGDDESYFRSLPQALRDKITKHAPVNV